MAMMASFRVLPGPLVGVGHEGTLGAILIADHACPLHPMWMRLEPSKRQPEGAPPDVHGTELLERHFLPPRADVITPVGPAG
jgi:hypothetical protein